jgi:hypothetical protein
MPLVSYIKDVLTEIKVQVLITCGNNMNVKIIHKVIPKTIELKKLTVIVFVVGIATSAISL